MIHVANCGGLTIRSSALRFLLVSAALVATSGETSRAAPEAVDADKLIVVDCLLPGQLRKLGGKMNYLGPRRPARVPASECEIRGGEYVAYDRANYSTALHVWLPLAENGDKQAQVYVGEIYEKGMGIAPDYAKAAAWYEKAAKQGDIQGLNHSAYLYEQGLGVNKDPVRALNLYRQAAGLSTDDLTFVSEVNAVREEAQAKIDTLSAQLEERDLSAQKLAAALDDTRRQLADQQTISEKAKRDAEEMRKRVRQLQAAPQTSTNTQELDRLKSELADREKKLSSQNAEIAKLEQTSTEQGDALRIRLSEAEREDTALRKQLGESQAQAMSDRAQLDSMRVRAQSIDRETRDLRAQVKTTENALQATQEQLRKAQSAQGDADRQHGDALKTTVSQQQVELDRQKAVIAVLDDQRQKLDSEVLRLQARVDDSQKLHAQEAKATAQAQDTATDLRARLASAQSDLLRKTVEQKDLASKLDAAARQLREDSKTLSATAGALGSKNADVQRLNTDLAKRDAALREQRAQLDELNATIKNDNQRLDEYKHKLSDVASNTRGITPSAVSVSEILSPEFGYGQSHALIIGNANYADKGHLAPLKTARKDAEDVDRLLQERYYGFKGHTVLLEDATHAQMINALFEIMKSVGNRDNLIIYYAGHGTLDQATGASYWLPIDADSQNPGNWVRDGDVTSWVSATKARHVLIIVDSCYGGAMTRGTSPDLVSNGSPSAEKLRMLTIARLPSRTVLTSGGVEPVLDSGPDGHSIFAHEFLDVLARNTQVLEATVLYTRLADQVRMSAMKVGQLTGKTIVQSPQISWLSDAGHVIGGEFLFVPALSLSNVTRVVESSPLRLAAVTLP
jgi:TPR repeat protein